MNQVPLIREKYAFLEKVTRKDYRRKHNLTPSRYGSAAISASAQADATARPPGPPARRGPAVGAGRGLSLV